MSDWYPWYTVGEVGVTMLHDRQTGAELVARRDRQLFTVPCAHLCVCVCDVTESGRPPECPRATRATWGPCPSTWPPWASDTSARTGPVSRFVWRMELGHLAVT